MEKSESIKELVAALVKAQAEYAVVKKDCDNPYFKSRYADLSTIIAAVKDSLNKNGISFSQFPFYEEGRAGVETFLFHSSGEFISGKCSLPVVKQDPQGVGSCISYARRYALQSMLGIAAEEDDDGNAAAGISITSAVASTPSPTPSPHSEAAKKLFISELQRKRLFAIAREAKVPHELVKQYLSDKYQIESTSQIPVTLYDKIISAIQTGEIMELSEEGDKNKVPPALIEHYLKANYLIEGSRQIPEPLYDKKIPDIQSGKIMKLSKEGDKNDANTMFDILETKEKLAKAGIKEEQIQEWFSSFYRSLGYENEHQLPANYLADWLEYLKLQLKERMQKNVDV